MVTLEHKTFEKLFFLDRHQSISHFLDRVEHVHTPLPFLSSFITLPLKKAQVTELAAPIAHLAASLRHTPSFRQRKLGEK